MQTINVFISALQSQIVTPIVTLLILAAFIVFIYGVVLYIGKSQDEAERKKGAEFMLWGIVGFVIMFGAATLVKIIQGVASSLL